MSEFLGIIQLVVYIGSLVSFYWMLKSDVRLLKQKIKDIENDREKKWKTYYDYKSKNCDKLNDVIVGIASLEKDIKWIVKKIDK